jgi:hypothetical protein
MEEMVKELKKIVSFKDNTSEGDIVLIAIENPKSVVYALVTHIERDEQKKEEWWHLTMHILGVPPQKVTWTLREAQFTGKDIFTMGNEGRFMQAIELNSPTPGGKIRETKNNRKPPKKKTALRVVK